MPALSSGDRLRARLDMLFVDHGVLRSVYLNAHPVTRRAWRAAQPGPRDTRGLPEKASGRSSTSEAVGRLAAPTSWSGIAVEDHGLTQIDFPIRSRSALEPQTLLAACDLFDRLEYPVLMHCKSALTAPALWRRSICISARASRSGKPWPYNYPSDTAT